VSIRDFVLAARRHILLFLSCALAVLAVGAYSALAAGPTYTARIQFLVSSTGSNDAGAVLQNNSLAVQRIPSYVPIVSSPLVVDPVVRNLRLPESAQAVAGRIEASSQLGTSLIDVTVHDRTPQDAYALAGAIGQVFGPVVESVDATPSGQSPVRVTIVRPPVLPTAPDWAGPARKVALALLLGLGLGAGAAVVRDLADNTLRDSQDLRTGLGIPALATVPLDSRLPARAVEDGSRSPQAEGFRRLRTTVQALRAADDLRSVLVAGPRADDAAPVVAADLAVALGLAGVRVLLIGADLRGDPLPELLAIDGTAGLTDVLIGEAAPVEVIQPWRRGPIDVLPAGPTPVNPSELLSSATLDAVLRDLETDYDLLLLIAPPVTEVTDATVLATAVSGTLLTVRCGRTPRGAIREALQDLRDVDARLLGAVVLEQPRRHRPAEPPRRAHRDTWDRTGTAGRSTGDYSAETLRLPRW
jgi:capsular exopolysaccharide synthesis family protein